MIGGQNYVIIFKYLLKIIIINCQTVFSPIPTSSMTLKYTVTSGIFCILLSMLCLILTFIGCHSARIEEDDTI